MKIMHLISGGDVGGAKTQVLTTLRELSKEHEATLVCFKEGDFAREAREMGIRTRVVKGNPFALRKKLLTGLRLNGYELLHCHGAKANFYGAWLRKKLDIPVISTVHSDPKLDYMGRPVANWTYGAINRHCLKKMDGWVAVSDSMKELLIRRGFDADRIWPIYNGIDFPKTLPHLPRQAYLERLGLGWDENHVIFGAAARLAPVKDVQIIICAFARTVEGAPNARLLIAGDGEERQKLETLAAEICPKGTYHFAGWQEDMNSFYHAVDVNLLSSRSETFPYAITEGARMYCAAIATAVGGVPSLIRDGETGLLMEPGDWETMARHMRRMAQDAPARRKMGIAIHDKVRREFSADAMLARQVEIYEDVLCRFFRQRRGRHGVVICGAYGRGNLGDEAILDAIIHQLRSRDPHIPITVLSRDPEGTAVRTGVSAIHTFDLFAAGKRMKKSTHYISGGGSLIQNATSDRSLRYYLHGIRQAKKAGCAVVMYGCGIGPVTGKASRHRVKRVLNKYVDRITLRDERSRAALESLGVTAPQIRVTGDPAIGTEPDAEGAARFWEQAHLDPERKYAMFLLRPWEGERQWLEEICGAADYVWECYGLMPVFACLDPERDEAIARRAVERVRVPCKPLGAIADGAVLCGVMEQMDLVVSMRLHGLVFAVGRNVPAVGISYDPKVAGFMEYLGSENWVELENLDRAELCQKIDDALSGKIDYADRVETMRSSANDCTAFR